MYVIDPGSGLPKKTNSGGNQNQNPFIQGESKNDTPFTNAIIPGTTQSYPTGSGPGTSNPYSITIPGFTPDYASLIANDPTYMQLQKDLAAQGVSDVATRNADINRALVGFGQVPDLTKAAQTLGISGLSDVVDPTTAKLASENQFSTAANLAQAHTKAIRAIRQNLAARHALQSGELGYQLGQEHQAFGQANNDATQKLLDYIGGVQAAFTTAQQQRQMQMDAAAATAAQTEALLHPPTGSQVAYWNGSGYQGPDGRVYDVKGNPAAANTSGVSQSLPSTVGPAADYSQNIAGSALDNARQRAGRGVYF